MAPPPQTAYLGSDVPPAITAENIGALKNAAYQKADQLGAAYSPQAYGGLVDNIISDAKASNINPALNPRATAAIEALQGFRNTIAERGTPPSLTELDQIRQFVNHNVSSSPEPSSGSSDKRSKGRSTISSIARVRRKWHPQRAGSGGCDPICARPQYEE